MARRGAAGGKDVLDGLIQKAGSFALGVKLRGGMDVLEAIRRAELVGYRPISRMGRNDRGC